MGPTSKRLTNALLINADWSEILIAIKATNMLFIFITDLSYDACEASYDCESLDT